MATYYEPKKKHAARHGFCYQMELNFDSEDVKRSFLLRMERTKERLAPSGSSPLDNCELLSSLLDKAAVKPCLLHLLIRQHVAFRPLIWYRAC